MTGIKPRTAQVVIYHGDDLARLSDLDDKVTSTEVALRVAERKFKEWSAQRDLSEEVPTDADVPAATEAHEAAVAERDTFAAEADQRGVTVTLKSLPRKDWRRLRNAYPPRDGNKEDELVDCDVDALPDEAIPLSVIKEESTIEGDVAEFLDSLTSFDYYNRLFMTVLALNAGGALADPKQRVGSVSSPI